MRHITDGELHAYLDGALGHLPDGRGDEVRHHLGECSVCRERLRDEEEIRSQAQEMLALAAPEEVPLPSFEDLRARADAAGHPEVGEKAPAHPRGPLRGMPLAWAATVVLALGVGWMGGEIWRTMPQESLGVPEPRNPALQSVPTSDSLGLIELRSGSGGAESELGTLDETALDAAREDVATAVGTPAEAIRSGAETNPPAAEAAPVEAEGARKAGALSDARQKALDAGSGVPETRRAAITPTPSAALMAPTVPISGAPAENEPGVLLRNLTASEEISMAVPGLDLLSVEWEEWTPGERALYIRQLLPMGDTLELRYLGLFMGSDPDAASTFMSQGRVSEEAPERPLSPKVMEASLPQGWNQVVMRWGRGWLVARAPLSVESLRGILRSRH
jgi:anti-sigma factor RsiW